MLKEAYVEHDGAKVLINQIEAGGPEDDFYDANYADDGQYWDGSGAWDLMAGGSYNGAGARPAHPAGLHKSQHGWIPIQTIAPGSGTTDLVLWRSSGAGATRYQELARWPLG